MTTTATRPHPLASAMPQERSPERIEAVPGVASYRSIGVHLKNHEDESEHVEVAIRLAARFGAHLTGILTQREPSILKTVYSGATLPIDKLEDFSNRAVAIADRFRNQTKERGITSSFEYGEGDAAELLGYVGRMFDLLVVEQTDCATDEIGFDVPERCLANCGRPVLIVPCRGSFPVLGRRIMIATNNSREASLAIHHALPFLSRAEQVTLLRGQSRERFSSITKWPGVTLNCYLDHHVPAFETREIDETVEAGAAILQAARVTEADLVVMGAYGRSRIAEWIWGGATRHVLKHASLPVLMAH